MRTIFNFGDPHKDFGLIADEILKEYDVVRIPTTNNKIFYNNEFQIVEASYGYALALDNLAGMKKAMGRLEKRDNIIFLGSTGSLSKDIGLDDLLIPIKVLNAFALDNEPKVVFPDKRMLRVLEQVLSDKNIPYLTYIDGSVRAVHDKTTNHKSYTNSLYGNSVHGLDCSESYVGLEFCKDNHLFGVVLLYCSDSPSDKILAIPKEEFDKRALKRDLDMHLIAVEVFERL